ncbi:MAG: hypothetical protein ACOX67_08205, partial [Oscillospiraceae bacterium]
MIMLWAGELEQIPLSPMYRDSTQRDVIDPFFAGAGVSPGILLETASNRVNAAMVEKGLSCSIFPRWYVEGNPWVVCFRAAPTGPLRPATGRGGIFSVRPPRTLLPGRRTICGGSHPRRNGGKMSIYEIFGRGVHTMTRALLEAARTADAILPGADVALKPNLVVAAAPERGAATHAGVLSGRIECLF